MATMTASDYNNFRQLMENLRSTNDRVNATERDLEKFRDTLDHIILGGVDDYVQIADQQKPTMAKIAAGLMAANDTYLDVQTGLNATAESGFFFVVESQDDQGYFEKLAMYQKYMGEPVLKLSMPSFWLLQRLKEEFEGELRELITADSDSDVKIGDETVPSVAKRVRDALTLNTARFGSQVLVPGTDYVDLSTLDGDKQMTYHDNMMFVIKPSNSEGQPIHGAAQVVPRQQIEAETGDTRINFNDVTFEDNVLVEVWWWDGAGSNPADISIAGDVLGNWINKVDKTYSQYALRPLSSFMNGSSDASDAFENIAATEAYQVIIDKKYIASRPFAINGTKVFSNDLDTCFIECNFTTGDEKKPHVTIDNGATIVSARFHNNGGRNVKNFVKVGKGVSIGNIVVSSEEFASNDGNPNEYMIGGLTVNGDNSSIASARIYNFTNAFSIYNSRSFRANQLTLQGCLRGVTVSGGTRGSIGTINCSSMTIDEARALLHPSDYMRAGSNALLITGCQDFAIDTVTGVNMQEHCVRLGSADRDEMWDNNTRIKIGTIIADTPFGSGYKCDGHTRSRAGDVTIGTVVGIDVGAGVFGDAAYADDNRDVVQVRNVSRHSIDTVINRCRNYSVSGNTGYWIQRAQHATLNNLYLEKTNGDGVIIQGGDANTDYINIASGTVIGTSASAAALVLRRTRGGEDENAEKWRALNIHLEVLSPEGESLRIAGFDGESTFTTVNSVVEINVESSDAPKYSIPQTIRDSGRIRLNVAGKNIFSIPYGDLPRFSPVKLEGDELKTKFASDFNNIDVPGVYEVNYSSSENWANHPGFAGTLTVHNSYGYITQELLHRRSSARTIRWTESNGDDGRRWQDTWSNWQDA